MRYRQLAILLVLWTLPASRLRADREPCNPGPLAPGALATPGARAEPAAAGGRCLARASPAWTRPKPLCAHDLELAKIAWKYFEANYQPKTGVVNAAHNSPSTTMWDTASAIAATIAAHQIGIITDKDFDDRIG